MKCCKHIPGYNPVELIVTSYKLAPEGKQYVEGYGFVDFVNFPTGGEEEEGKGGAAHGHGDYSSFVYF